MKSLMLVAVLATACAPGPQTYRGTVTVRSAELMPLDPDVKVVADADEPMFFVTGSYWMFHDASWYRADKARSAEWNRVQRPPWQVRKIDQPYAFTRYRLEKREQTASARLVDTPAVVPAPAPPPKPEASKPSRDQPAPAQPGDLYGF